MDLHLILPTSLAEWFAHLSRKPSVTGSLAMTFASVTKA